MVSEQLLNSEHTNFLIMVGLQVLQFQWATFANIWCIVLWKLWKFPSVGH